MSELPNGWESARFGDLCEPSQYGYTAKAGQSGNIHFLRTTDITSGPIDWGSVPFCDVNEETRAKYILHDGDVVISRAGSVGFSCLIRQPRPSVFASYLIRFRPRINADYFKYFLLTPNYWNAIGEQSLGIAVQNVNASNLSEIDVPVAPEAEQTRIVEKLEELLSDLDAGVAELKAAQKKLGQYRQSLLKAAVEGALTAEWRRQRQSPSPQPLPHQDGWTPSPLSPRGRGAGGEGANLNTAAPDEAWLKQRAKELRREQTPFEHTLWQQLRAKRFSGFKFRRQQVLGRYIVDFVCMEKRLIVEADGGQHNTDSDGERDAWLQQQGFHVLRVWNNDIAHQLDAVLELIWQALQQESPLPNPSPARGEGLQTETGAIAPLSPCGRGAGGEGINQETGAQLLQRILTERRARWEAKQLAKFKEQGKTPPKDWQKKYPEPVQPDTSDLPELPEGWVWASVDMLGEIASGVAKGTKRDTDVQVREVPYLRVANVQRGFLDLSEVKTILATERDIAELTLQAGDVLFNEGGDRDKLGRGWVWRDEVANCIHQNHVFRMRPYLPEVLPELISHHGNTFGKTWFQNAGKQTTNLASINMTMLRMFPVPLGPAEEQRELLNQLDLQIENLNRQEQAVELGLKQSTAQRKNILRAAFSGQLVPQDPNDEAASVLLERIRAERAAQAAMKKPLGRKIKEPRQ